METTQSTIIVKPKQLCLTSNEIEIIDCRMKQYRIPYGDLILATLIISNEEKGICCEPEITEITNELEGDLILYDCRHIRWQIPLKGTGRTAGSLLSELAAYAPHILIGKQTWIDIENEKDFEEIGKMVNLMSRC